MESELKKWKDKFLGDEVLLFAPGPTLNIFQDNFGDIKRCGVNGTILHEDIRNKLDFFIWSGDLDIPRNPNPNHKWILENSKKLNKNVLKFVNCWTDNKTKGLWNIQTQIHPEIAKEYGFIRYNQVVNNRPSSYYCKDLSDSTSGACIDTVAFAAIQILLYMGFKKIILVGFDCGGDHSYKKYKKYKEDVCNWGKNINKDLIDYWINFKNWLSREYKDREIKIVNPIGLKNIFEEYI